MRRALALLFPLAGCISDLAVGMTISPVYEDGGALPELDAGPQPTRDAGEQPDLDAGHPKLDGGRDAGADAGRDAGTGPVLCAPTSCIQYLVGADRCDDGGVITCARPSPELACEFLCL